MTDAAAPSTGVIARGPAAVRRPPGRHARPRSDPRSPSYRADIEGLRAVAVLGVLIYHAGAPFLPGGFVGVDVFFVISGYLITALIHDEIARTRRLSLPRFYARRARRLMPAAAAVLTLTAVASSVLLPPLQRASAGADVLWASLFAANWRFAIEQTDYLNQEAAPSPVLHYWSLAVEEQYYFVWPVLLGILGAVMVRRRKSLRFALFSAMACLGVVSFAWSLHLTETNQPYAFFGTPARVWELAVGGCLALAAPKLGQVRTVVRGTVGWIGLVMVVGSMFVLEESGPFPGTAALWPTLGTAAILFAGTTARSRTPRIPRNGPAMVLDRRFMRHTGRISYSLYLWHWPPLVIMAAVLEQPKLSFALGLVVTAVMWPVAWLSWALLEEPFRRSRALSASTRRSLGVGAVCTAAAVASAFLLMGSAGSTVVTVAQPGGATVQIDPASAVTDAPSDQARCQQPSTATVPEPCVHGPEDAERTVVLWGDSHAYQWFDAMAAFVDERGWRLESYAKSGCPAADVVPFSFVFKRGYDECVTWNAQVRDRLTDPDTRPDVVVTAARSNILLGTDDELVPAAKGVGEVADGYETVFRDLDDAGVEVVALGSVPEAGQHMPTCISQHPDDVATSCGFEPFEHMLKKQGIQRAAERVDGVDYVDTVGLVCPDDACAPVQRGVIVYRDSNHLTRSFVLEITPQLRKKLIATGAFETDSSA